MICSSPWYNDCICCGHQNNAHTCHTDCQKLLWNDTQKNDEDTPVRYLVVLDLRQCFHFYQITSQYMLLICYIWSHWCSLEYGLPYTLFSEISSLFAGEYRRLGSALTTTSCFAIGIWKGVIQSLYCSQLQTCYEMLNTKKSLISTL